MAKFLSEEWVTQARAIQDEYKGKGAPAAAKARINLTITSVPADVSDGDLAAKVDTTEGGIDLDVGNFDTPDATITLEYDTAKAFLIEGDPKVVMQAVMSGKVKISGDMSKVLALGASGEIDPVAVEVSERIKAITD